MAFITKEFYIDNFCGSESNLLYPDEIDTLIKIASDIIDSVCLGKISKSGGIDLLPDFVSEKVRKAVCAETAFLERNGGLSSIDSSEPVQMSLGKFSYTYTSKALPKKGSIVSPLALVYLEASGLLYRGLS